MKSNAAGAILAQAVQAFVNLVLQILVLRLLGVDEYGRFAILFGVTILATAVLTGLIGDSLVVLDRADRSVRAALQNMLTLGAAGLALLAGGISWGVGFSAPAEAILFALALGAFGVQEILRRLLMANLAFFRVAAADLASFAIVLTIIAAAHVAGLLSLAVVFGAIVLGQTVACAVGWRLVPARDRLWAQPRGAEWTAVWRYGRWRGLQQVLRPSLFTGTRLVVLAMVGVSAVGMLEASRVYASPLILVIGGMSSFLFVRFADKKKTGAAASLREADRVVGLLLGLTAILSVAALTLAPWVGPLLFGLRVELLAVGTWLAYGMSVAFVTPYGALGAVGGRQVEVFIIRLADSVIGIALAVAIVALGLSHSWVPIGLALASAAGGLALRRVVARDA